MQSHGEQARASRRPRTPDVGGTTRVSRSRQSRNKIDGTPLPNASVFLNGLAFLDDYPYKGLMTACALMFCAIVRYALSLQPYSGMGKPPMYGDYEAQRHWMEITTALPIGDWYRNTTDNDLMYWGLDYPPLTAYVSWVCGKVAQVYEPNLVALHTSRGYETPSSKVFMRMTVLVTDMLYFMAVLRFVQWGRRCAWSQRVFHVLVILSQPALMLIDHGHFQYNSFSLGLVLVSIIAVMRGRDVVGAVFFCLALNFKTMILYYSPAVFCYYLARCIKPPGQATRSSLAVVLLRVAVLAVTVIGTFAALWWPFCVLAAPGVSCSEGLMHVVHRMFPFGRGLFEDKVSNLWCIGDILFKFRRRFAQPTLLRMSTGLTLLLMSPACYAMLARVRTSVRSFLWALFTVSLSFFLASFQALLGIDYPVFAGWFGAVATFSMYPLLLKDGLMIPYVISFPWFLSITLSRDGLAKLTPAVRMGVVCSLLGGVAVHAFVAFIPAPLLQRYPDLGAVAISAYSCAMFVLAWCVGNYMLLGRRRAHHARRGRAASSFSASSTNSSYSATSASSGDMYMGAGHVQGPNRRGRGRGGKHKRA